MAAGYFLARACCAPDEAFPTLDALAVRLLALIGADAVVMLRDANLGRADSALPAGPCVSVRRGRARDGDLVAYVLIRPVGADDMTRLQTALTRAEVRHDEAAAPALASTLVGAPA